MPSKEIDYAKLSAELDKIVEALQSSDLGVDEALKQYERGMRLVKDLEAYLKDAENKVRKIKAGFDKA